MILDSYVHMHSSCAGGISDGIIDVHGSSSTTSRHVTSDVIGCTPYDDVSGVQEMLCMYILRSLLYFLGC
jgi:hypothetical protein